MRWRSPMVSPPVFTPHGLEPLARGFGPSDMCPHEPEFLVLHLTLDQEACSGTEGVLRRGGMGEANYGMGLSPKLWGQC